MYERCFLYNTDSYISNNIYKIIYFVFLCMHCEIQVQDCVWWWEKMMPFFTNTDTVLSEQLEWSVNYKIITYLAFAEHFSSSRIRFFFQPMVVSHYWHTEYVVRAVVYFSQFLIFIKLFHFYKFDVYYFYTINRHCIKE